MSFRGNQFPQLASPAVTICRFGTGWGFCFNKPSQKEVIGTKKYVEIDVDKDNRRIYFRFTSFKRDGVLTVSISGRKSSYRSLNTLATVPAGLLESLKVVISEKKQYVLHRYNIFGDGPWCIYL